MSRLEDISAQFRDQQVAKNPYNKNDEFDASHPNAISDGDNKGKGENNGQIGSADDIRLRHQQLVKNKYNKNNEYNDSTA